MHPPDKRTEGLAARVAASLAAGAPAAPAAGGATRRVAVQRPPSILGWAEAMEGQSLMLLPGQLHFSERPAGLKTLLGSCVALTLWHPARRIGGMCHFLLPERQRQGHETLDGRYGDEAVAALVQAIERHGARPADFVAHLYGGADTMGEAAGVKLNVGERNIERGWSLIDQFGFQLDGVDVGDNVPRTVTLALATGEVQCRRGAPAH
jgi:chemotaxis protein CheD